MLATFAGGCFWCTEAVFDLVDGVNKITPGYTGGSIQNPTYEQVCKGNTGHAEAIQIEYDEKIVSFEGLLEVFFETHDPTTLNRQGNDKGTQYRSAIFYHDEDQKLQAERFVNNLNESSKYDSPIVTTFEKYNKFYEAEDYHKNYYENNKFQPYCMFVIRPKVEKMKQINSKL